MKTKSIGGKTTPIIHVMQPPKLNDYLWLFLLAMVWGSSFLFIKIAVEEIPPFSVAAGRLIIAAIFLYSIALWGGHALPLKPINWLFMLAVAVLGNAMPFFMIAWGEQFVDSGLAAILMALTPLATPTIAHLFTHDEKWSLAKFAGVMIGLIGVAVLIGLDKIMGLGQSQIGLETMAQFAILIGALGYATAALFNRALARGNDGDRPLSFRGVAAGTMILAVIAIVPIALIHDKPWQAEWVSHLSFSAIGSVVYLGIFPTALGHLLLLKIVQKQGASFLSNVNFLVPVIGLLYGVILLGEVPSRDALIGLALILSGIFLATHLAVKAKHEPKS